ncbi:MAG TPA: hypothetical protein VGC91_20485 [Pyrinomonadaceae bacterium]|jgi:hypothetical protein
MGKSKIIIPREVLLIEIERRCHAPECGARNRVGLTKDEARAYCGFECERCKEWNADSLTERDAPEWWEELAVTDLYAVRETRSRAPGDAGEVITRMSDNYRQTKNEN